MTRPSSVVVIAASAGGLVPLRKIAAGLPPGFPAAVIVANHAPPRASLLPMILSAGGPLPATCARDRQPLEAGRILIAPPARHLRLERGGTVRVTRHPQKALVRPSADVLFESAAWAFGPRAVGIVLSGRGNDGAVGLALIRAAGGIAIVQSPDDALCTSMPRNALALVQPDACAPAAEIVPTLDRLLRARIGRPAEKPAPGAFRKGRAGASLRGLRVLVAEDRYLLGSEIVGMLRKLGCSAAGPVPDVASGWKILDSGVVDCALLDVDLRGVKVFPLAWALRERGIPIVFATGYGAESLPDQWRTSPRLEKPFDVKALGAALRLALNPRPAKAARAPPPPPLQRSAETLKELRNLLMLSQVWMRNLSRRMDGRPPKR